ncbi:MAG: hypothetical protein JJ889_07640 [Maricaulis sp.]|nr:hypothetical protein [Maricaulis sp.]
MVCCRTESGPKEVGRDYIGVPDTCNKAKRLLIFVHQRHGAFWHQRRCAIGSSGFTPRLISK